MLKKLMLKKLLLKPLLLKALLLMSFSFSVKASDVEALVEITRAIENYQAKFEQNIQDQFGNSKDKSSGHFIIQKPFKFVWQTESPFEQKIVSNGETLWTFDQDLDQVNIQTLNKAMGNTPVFLLGANAETLQKTFNVKQLVSGDDAAKTFELTPVEQGYAFERMLVLFKQGKLKEILLLDTLGQKTIVEFSESTQNEALDTSVFEFTVPEGVDVVDSRQKEAH
jgi:outer membrane lipoprotein carrier protein